MSHLVELRDRLLRVVLVVAVIFLGLFSFANDLYHLLAKPLLAHMPEGGTMIATEVASPFLTPFKLALVVSIFAAIPFILYQAWAFIAPGLYRNEKALALPLLISSIISLSRPGLFRLYEKAIRGFINRYGSSVSAARGPLFLISPESIRSRKRLFSCLIWLSVSSFSSRITRLSRTWRME